MTRSSSNDQDSTIPLRKGIQLTSIGLQVCTFALLLLILMRLFSGLGYTWSARPFSILTQWYPVAFAIGHALLLIGIFVLPTDRSPIVHRAFYVPHILMLLVSALFSFSGILSFLGWPAGVSWPRSISSSFWIFVNFQAILFVLSLLTYSRFGMRSEQTSQSKEDLEGASNAVPKPRSSKQLTKLTKRLSILVGLLIVSGVILAVAEWRPLFYLSFVLKTFGLRSSTDYLSVFVLATLALLGIFAKDVSHFLLCLKQAKSEPSTILNPDSGTESDAGRRLPIKLLAVAASIILIVDLSLRYWHGNPQTQAPTKNPVQPTASISSEIPSGLLKNLEEASRKLDERITETREKFRGDSLGSIPLSVWEESTSNSATDPSPDEIYSKALQVYSTCRTYQDKAKTSIKDAPMAKEVLESESTTAFVRDGIFQLKLKWNLLPVDEITRSPFHLWADGKEVKTWWNPDTPNNLPNHYQTRLSYALGGVVGRTNGTAQVLPNLLLGKPFGGGISSLKSLTRLEDKPLGDRTCWRIKGQDGSTIFVLWVDCETFVIRRMEQVGVSLWVTEIEPLVDEEIAPQELVFAPPES
jgi:hypothetical protein